MDRDFVLIQQIAPGKKTNLANFLPKVKNTSAFKQEFGISFQEPTSYKKGYKKIPDPKKWFYPVEKKITLEPGQESMAEGFYLGIPKNFSNQHYQTTLTVRSEGGISLEVSIPVWIETEGKADAPSSGPFGFSPSLIDFESSDSGQKKIVYLHNTSSNPASYTLFPFLPPQRSKWAIMPPSAGYEWLAKEENISLRTNGKKITENRWEAFLKPKERLAIELSLTDVDNVSGREAFLVAVPQGFSGWEFARIRIGRR